jgi:hypothetical protein
MNHELERIWTELAVTCVKVFENSPGGTKENHKVSVRTDAVLRFEVFTVVTMKNGVFWDVML